MLDECLIRIFDELLQEFSDRDAEIVRSEFHISGLLNAEECQIIDAKILYNDKFATMFGLLKAKNQKDVFRKVQEICVKYKWRDLLKTIQLKLESVQRVSFILTIHEQQQIHQPFTHDIPRNIELFVGREKQLAELYQLINPSSNSDAVSKSVSSIKIAICGLGGVGKTQLALKYIKDNILDFDFIVWINSESQQSTADSFFSLAEALKVSDVSKDIKIIVAEVYRKLSKTSSKTIIVFDNADDYDYIPNDFMPGPLYCFFILVTSRNQEWKGMKKLNLEIFTDEEAANFIKKSLNNENYDSENEVASLANTLHNFPLALKQAIAYISQCHAEASFLSNRFTINDYLKEYDGCRKRLLNYSDEYNNVNVATTLNTWTVTVEKLKTLSYSKERLGENQDMHLSDKTLQIKILHLISYMASEKIDPKLFLEVADRDEKRLGWAVFKLDKYSMVHFSTAFVMNVVKDNRKFLNVHKLVQQVTRLRLEEKKEEEQTFKIVFRILDTNFPVYSNTMENIAKQRELLIHLAALKSEIEYYAKKLKVEIRMQQDYLHQILIKLHIGYNSIGNPAQEKNCLLQLLLIQHRDLGFSNHQTAITLTNLGNAIGALGHPKSQKMLLERALKIKESHYGPGHVEVAKTLANLANAYGQLGDPKTKKIFLERALKNLEENYGPDHFEVAKILTSLANAYGQLGDPKTKITLLERALKSQESHYGDDHFEVAKTLLNLANAHSQLGDPKEQKKLLERALKIEENHYGPDHFEVAKILMSLANAHSDFGDPNMQKTLLERALKIEENYYGPDHFEVAKTLTNLANAHAQLGDPRMQQKLLERALKIEENHYGSDHFEVAKILASLANAYGDMGEPNTQKILLERALNIQESHFGADHFEGAATLTNLAFAYGQLGDPKMEKTLLERALKIKENHYGPDHFEVAKTLTNLANAYGHLEDRKMQKSLLERALNVQESHFGANHFEVAGILASLAFAYGRLGDPKTQKTLLERVLNIQESHYGADHFEIARSLINLANAYAQLGDLKTYRMLLERALKIRETHFGPEHFETILTAVLLTLSSGDLSKADPKLLEKFLSAAQSRFPPDHPLILGTLKQLAGIYARRGEEEKEAELLNKYDMLQLL